MIFLAYRVRFSPEGSSWNFLWPLSIRGRCPKKFNSLFSNISSTFFFLLPYSCEFLGSEYSFFWIFLHFFVDDQFQLSNLLLHLCIHCPYFTIIAQNKFLLALPACRLVFMDIYLSQMADFKNPAIIFSRFAVLFLIPSLFIVVHKYLKDSTRWIFLPSIKISYGVDIGFATKYYVFTKKLCSYHSVLWIWIWQSLKFKFKIVCVLCKYSLVICT